MAGLLKKILPVLPQSMPRNSDDDGDDDKITVEYSFAMEYIGPPLSLDIPRAVPVDFDQIPTAAALASASMLSGMSLPVIQPLVKGKPLDKKLSSEPKLGSKPALRSNSRTPSISNGARVSCEPAVQIDNSGVLGRENGIKCASAELPEEIGGSLGCENGNALEAPKILDEQGSSVGCTNGADDKCTCGIGSSSGRKNGDECTANSSDEKHGELGTRNDGECTPKAFETGSLRRLESSTSQDNSQEISKLSPCNVQEEDTESTESEITSHSASSEIFSGQEEEDRNNVPPGHVKRPSVVTFRDPEQSDVVHEESDESQAASIDVKPKAERKGKKGTCYRCLKGNQLTAKEICIVCGAKYCGNCVLRAMGSMPEGRKCVTCIGFQIDEVKRGSLGKCSQVLRRLLTELEVQQIMRSEISCAANQLPPELIFVNGEHLSLDELLLLQNCPNPPHKLRPGSYWYDKVSGYWGKEGQKPCQIISPQLKVGGEIKRCASNGNTNITINGREITKPELWLLQAAGVQCEGKPSFWLSADGSYQEEGQKNIKGCIWDKTRVKVACAIFSLPFPSHSVNCCEEEMNGDSPNYLAQKALKKLLLVGYEKSGTSTIYKQAKTLYNVPFTEDERQNVKLVIQSNLYTYIAILLEGREQFEEESLIDMRRKRSVDEPGPSGENDKTIYSISPRLKAFSDWLIQVFMSGNLEIIFPAAAREYAPFVEELWKDPAFQATYARRSELKMLPGIATYFVQRAVEISKTNYKPSDMDILNAEGITSSNGLSCMEFSFPRPRHESCVDSDDYHHESLLRYQLVRVHPRSLGGNCKWLEMFEDVDIILFCVSLTDYDEFFVDRNGVITNKMMASKQLFENIVTHPAFKEKNFLLVLNKFDLLEQKIEQVPLTRCEWFHDFRPVISHNHNNIGSSRNNNATFAQRAFHYIAWKFKRLFDTFSDRKLFVSPVTGLEPASVDETLRYAREILKWYEEQHASINNVDLSSYDASSSS